jgi:hypothetical protein
MIVKVVCAFAPCSRIFDHSLGVTYDGSVIVPEDLCDDCMEFLFCTTACLEMQQFEDEHPTLTDSIH